MIDLDEFQRRVDQYFQCGQRSEPGGRIILDLMRALREQSGQATDAEVMRAQGGVIAHLRAENERLQAQLDLSARAWKTWEATLRARDMEVAELRAELRRMKLGAGS